jgi:hypothetical protein
MQSRAHEVETNHGLVLEAAIRSWLTEFLPRRYGVTSGYVVSHARAETDPLPHFDLLLYDAFETPTLWVERALP